MTFGILTLMLFYSL
uniref:Uncharacterized protein n=1 Tax=Rhizophora mucronata TaxID=61149 RepID=A0A2P2NQ49_RHIMU